MKGEKKPNRDASLQNAGMPQQIRVPAELQPLNLQLMKLRRAIVTAVNTLGMGMDYYEEAHKEFVRLVTIYRLREEAMSQNMKAKAQNP